MHTFTFAESDETLAGGPTKSYLAGEVVLGADQLTVSMGSPPVFSTAIPLSSIRRVERLPDLTGPTRGVHGFLGKWIVNRGSTGIVRLTLRPRVSADLELANTGEIPTKGAVVRWITRSRRLRLRELTLSVDNADALAAELASGPNRP
jgi:hypothetical protein